MMMDVSTVESPRGGCLLRGYCKERKWDLAHMRYVTAGFKKTADSPTRDARRAAPPPVLNPP